MHRPTLYIAATNHGFGHAVRACSVGALVQKLYPEMLLILATSAPRWLLESYIPGDFIYRPQVFDVGVVQGDSLNMNLEVTLERLLNIISQQEKLIAQEVNYLQMNKVDLVLGDIPPLMCLIAKEADIPCWMMGNFGWDYIYRPWRGAFTEVANWIRDCYAQSDRLFRLPLSEPMSAFSRVIDVGLTGGVPHYSQQEIRQQFEITKPYERTVLLTFGGLGLTKIPYENLEHFADWQFISFDREAPNVANLIKVTDPCYRPVDFMPICHRILTKPGFSTFAEAMRLGAAITSVDRQGFAETELLLTGLKNYSNHQIISIDQFFKGTWNFLDQPIQKPIVGDDLDKRGTETIAKEIIEFLSK